VILSIEHLAWYHSNPNVDLYSYTAFADCDKPCVVVADTVSRHTVSDSDVLTAGGADVTLMTCHCQCRRG